MFGQFPAGDEDTSAAVTQLKFARLSAMQPTERLQRFFSLCSAARKFVDSGIRLRHGNCSPEEFKKRKAALLLGAEFSRKHFNWDPEIEGY